MKFQDAIGRAAIERRARQLVQRLTSELPRIDGVSLLTNPDPTRSAAIIVFKPGNLEPRKFASTLYEKEKIVVASGGNAANHGVRISPHFYNTMEEVDRSIAAVRKYMASGLSS
jgi:selenocysteine lyase/cysteine desulfurase